MNIDIENINTFENRNKVYTNQWRTIYEVIEEYYFTESDIFPDDLKKWKDNANEDINIPIEVKNNTKIMEMEQGLYAQVFKISREDLKFIAENRNKMKQNSSSKVNLQDHSVGLILTLIGPK